MMRQFAYIFLFVAIVAFSHSAVAQTPLFRGCGRGGSNIPYPTPEVYGNSVQFPASSYVDNMACSFILNLPELSPPVFDSVLTFSKFKTENQYDFVEVYNGCDRSRPRSTGNVTVPPCTQISDFPFQIMRKSGVYK
jgi:hypothetical protein